MTFQARIDQEIKAAMLARETLKLGVLRMLKAALMNSAIEKHGAGGALDDSDAMAIVRKEIKKRHDSIEGFEKGGRPAMADNERAEIEILSVFLPAAPSAEEVAALVREAIALIGHLEPKPGRRFVDVERNIVVPDVLVVKVGKSANARFQVRLNPDVMPRLRVHDVYANALRSHRGEGTQALQQRLQEARWFIKNIQQRFDTILRVSTAIVERQKSFFTHGELAMRPLVLREIADELGLHESTISRVTTAKYMATPFGTFELKYFFGSGLGTDSGGNASSTAVRALIKQFIAAEDLKKPLSDNQLSEMLKEQGIDCARRTVAKYREGLRIATASLRKAL